MFQFYGRRETSFVCACVVSRRLFGSAIRCGKATVLLVRFPRHLEEGEFVLWMEHDARGKPTGRELTMFVTCISCGTVKLETVKGNPDEFWKQVMSEV